VREKSKPEGRCLLVTLWAVICGLKLAWWKEDFVCGLDRLFGLNLSSGMEIVTHYSMYTCII